MVIWGTKIWTTHSNVTQINVVQVNDRMLLEHTLKNYSFNSENKARAIFYFKGTVNNNINGVTLK